VNRATGVPGRWQTTGPASGVTMVPKPPLYKPALGLLAGNFVGRGNSAQFDSTRNAGSHRQLQAVEGVRELHNQLEREDEPTEPYGSMRWRSLRRTTTIIASMSKAMAPATPLMTIHQCITPMLSEDG
jgi:hypothetical protein